jgi:seryl-tRNA synthetase
MVETRVTTLVIDIQRLLADPEGVRKLLWWRGEDVDTASIVRLHNELLRVRASEPNSPREKELAHQLSQALETIPALPHRSTPLNRDKSAVTVVREHLSRPMTPTKAPSHVDIATKLNLLNFTKGSEIAGTKFATYVGWGARLERALISYMLDRAHEANYTLVAPALPWVREQSLFTAGVLPKFREQVYQVDNRQLFLVPTAEVVLASLHDGESLDETILPLRYASYTPCFRREAGATRSTEPGLIRIHQFNKVELVWYSAPDDSCDNLELLVHDAERVLQGLELHYRVVLLPSSDLAQQATKAYDLLVWLPSLSEYYEVSTCSNCEDYQARRGLIQLVSQRDGPAGYVHTLNGSALATSRLFAAILENHLQEDGSIRIPVALRPYLGGMDRIRA